MNSNSVQLDNEQYINFSKLLLEFMMNEGFGVRNKKDIEVYIFHLLFNVFGAFPDKTIYQLSNFLKVSESKVKNIILESGLRYQSDFKQLRQETINEIIQSILDNKLNYEENSKNFKFRLDNPLKRREFEALIKERGYTSDSSFNKDIVSIKLNVLIEVLGDSIDKSHVKVSNYLSTYEGNEQSVQSEQLNIRERVAKFFNSNSQNLSLFLNFLALLK